jgi:hypothetical protein
LPSPQNAAGVAGSIVVGTVVGEPPPAPVGTTGVRLGVGTVAPVVGCGPGVAEPPVELEGPVVGVVPPDDAVGVPEGSTEVAPVGLSGVSYVVSELLSCPAQLPRATSSETADPVNSNGFICDPSES